MSRKSKGRHAVVKRAKVLRTQCWRVDGSQVKNFLSWVKVETSKGCRLPHYVKRSQVEYHQALMGYWQK